MGKLVSSHLLQGFQGSLPHWHTHKACYVSESGKYVVGLLFCVEICRCPCKTGKWRSAIRKEWQIVKYLKPNTDRLVPTLRASATACYPKKGKPTPPCPDLRPVRRAKIFVWPVHAPMVASAPPAGMPIGCSHTTNSFYQAIVVRISCRYLPQNPKAQTS